MKTDERLADEAADKLFPTGTRVFKEANAVTILAAIREAKSAARQEPCAVCGGDGKPASGLPCICKGTGLLHIAELECRKLIYDLERKIEKLELTARQDTEPTQMFLCEINNLFLHPNQLYVFQQAPECQGCADYAQGKVAARCGLDEGEQKKDLGVTEPVADNVNAAIQKALSELDEDMRSVVESLSFHKGMSDCHYIVTGGEYADQGDADLLIEITDANGGSVAKWIWTVLKLASDPKGADSVALPTASSAPPLSPNPVSVQERSESDSTRSVSLNDLHAELHKMIQCSMAGVRATKKAHQLLYKIKRVSISSAATEEGKT